MRVTKRLFTVFCSFVIAVAFCITPVYGAGKSIKDIITNRKISPELRGIMDGAEKDELIQVYIFRRMLSASNINKLVLKETGIDPSPYEGGGLSGEIVLSESENKITMGGTVSLLTSIDVSKYLKLRREIVKREYGNANERFIKKYLKESKKVIYRGEYTSTLIVEVTPDEICRYAALPDVVYISCFEDDEQAQDLNISLSQIHADREDGTKSQRYNYGNGYTGAGVVIGVIEAGGGMFDRSVPHLDGIPESQLTYVYNYREDGTVVEPTISEHATKVISLIVGKSVTAGGYTYEGIAPDATVYQTSAQTTSDVFMAFNLLADLGVNIINYSGGCESSGYTAYDREIDRLIQSTKITFVKSAGNSGGDISSPGKGLNVITVGNLNTKTDYNEEIAAPYSLHPTSAYREADYLPNKPDVVAPGTMLTTRVTENSFSSGTGTSYSAPIVTGFIAQMMQRVPSLMGNPYRAKALLISFCDRSSVLEENDAEADNEFIRDRSGAGMIDASQLLLGFTHGDDILYFHGTKRTYNPAEFTEGQTIRIVMVFFKSNGIAISSAADMDDLDLKLLNSSGEVVAESSSRRNNVEIIEFTVPEDGEYFVQVCAATVKDTAAGVPYGISWRVLS